MKVTSIENIGNDILPKKRNGSRIVTSKINSFKSLSQNINYGDVVVLVGDTSMGKTTMLLNLLVHQAIQNKENVLLLALNDSSWLIWSKILNILKELGEIDAFKRIFLNPEPFQTLADVQDFISDSVERFQIRGVFIDDDQVFSKSVVIRNIKDATMNEPSYLDMLNGFHWFLREFSETNYVNIVTTAFVAENKDRPFSVYCSTAEVLNSKPLFSHANLVLMLDRLEYHGYLETTDGEPTENRTYMKIIKRNQNALCDSFNAILINDCCIK